MLPPITQVCVLDEMIGTNNRLRPVASIKDIKQRSRAAISFRLSEGLPLPACAQTMKSLLHRSTMANYPL